MRRVASVKTNVVDTVGAGDSHIGAIIAGMSKGMKVEDAVLLANRTAAAIVGTSGPVNGPGGISEDFGGMGK